jgi:hypothetical protein
MRHTHTRTHGRRPFATSSHRSLADEPESSIFIEYDSTVRFDRPDCIPRLLILSKRLKSLAMFKMPGNISGRPRGHERPQPSGVASTPAAASTPVAVSAQTSGSAPVAAAQLRLLPLSSAIAAIATRGGEDDDVALTTFELPLRDRFSLQRITVPCRGDACSHNECFDLQSYDERNRGKRASLCPICSVELPRRHLHIDELVLRLLAVDDGDTATLTTDGFRLVAADAAADKVVDVCCAPHTHSPSPSHALSLSHSLFLSHWMAALPCISL